MEREMRAARGEGRRREPWESGRQRRELWETQGANNASRGRLNKCGLIM